MRGFSFPSDNIAFRGLFGMLPKQRVEPEIAERIEILSWAIGNRDSSATVSLARERHKQPCRRVTDHRLDESRARRVQAGHPSGVGALLPGWPNQICARILERKVFALSLDGAVKNASLSASSTISP